MIFDAHFHVIDPNYPLVMNQGYLPNAFTVKDYLLATKGLGFKGGAIVSGSFQSFDQTYLISALKALGDNYVGVTQLPITVSDAEILQLHDQGIRAVRFNLYRGGSEKIEHLEHFAKRIYDLAKWHIELYVDSDNLPELEPILSKLPKVCIDHLGLSKTGFNNLLKLVEQGVHVKASGFMRVDFDVAPALVKIYNTNPEALMFGSDLPGTRASRLFSPNDLTLIRDHFSKEAIKKILWDNAISLYHG